MDDPKRVVMRFVELREEGEGQFRVWLKVDQQSFPVGAPRSRENAEWYASMLRIALVRLHAIMKRGESE